MKHILCGTNRPGSRSMEVCKIIQEIFAAEGEQVEIIDLAQVGLEEVTGRDYGSENLPLKIKKAVDTISHSEGIMIVCPEYNGSMPGALKYFIDFWKYPESFEHRPVAFVGLGARFGGLRPVEHLQGVFGFRNSYCYPNRVFLTDVFKVLKDGKIEDPRVQAMLVKQVQGFRAFVRALQSEGLDAVSIAKAKAAHP